MRILHLSDLHFGTESENIVSHLTQAITLLNPALVIISGDFTQVASKEEFSKAQNFIKSFAAPVICVPGNHDVPRYHMLERFLDPFKKYRDYICSDLFALYKNEHINLVGLNTARRCLPHWNWANGAIAKSQLKFLETHFAGLDSQYRICVLHHPVHKAEKAPLKVTVFGAKRAMKKIRDFKTDLVLTGHVHHASITVIDKTVFASASTAISSRIRAQGNGFNVIDLEETYFEITHYNYKDGLFAPSSALRYEKTSWLK